MNGLCTKTMVGYPVQAPQTGHLPQALFAGEINYPALQVVASLVVARKPWVGDICQVDHTVGAQGVGFASQLAAWWDQE